VQPAVGGTAWFHENPSQKNMSPFCPTAHPLPLPFPLVPPLIIKTLFKFDVGKVVYSVGLSSRHCPAVATVEGTKLDAKIMTETASARRIGSFLLDNSYLTFRVTRCWDAFYAI
jgi:hypothetical protein